MRALFTPRDAGLTRRVLTAESRCVMIDAMNPLDRAIEVVGGVGKLADAIGLKSNVVSNWRLREQVPAERCIAIEQATGGAVTRHDLRPDVFGYATIDIDSAAA